MSKYRILIADDDRKHLSQVQGYFSEQEEVLHVDVAMDGWQVLERLRERSYDAMLMDLIMPKLDGFGVLEQVPSCCTEEEPMVMIVSAIHSEGMVRNACTLGAKYFMVKPGYAV